MSFRSRTTTGEFTGLTPNVYVTTIAIAVVFVELWVNAWSQNPYIQTPFLCAAMRVVVGGALVLDVGVLIGDG